MNQKKRAVKIIILLLMIGSSLCMGLIIYNQQNNRPMPDIVFYTNSTRIDSLFFCSNGDLYLGFSEESFLMSMEDVSKRIQQNDYGDILKYVGNVGEGKIKRMYAFYQNVCLKDGYHLECSSYLVPNGGREYDDFNRGWYGIYFDERGQMKLSTIYRSRDREGAEYECSDVRAYTLVKWMHKCMIKYAR